MPHCWFCHSVSPCQSSLSSCLATRLSFPHSCPLRGQKAHFGLLLFLFVLEYSTGAQNRGENGVLLFLVPGAPLSQDCLDVRGAKARSANSRRHYCVLSASTSLAPCFYTGGWGEGGDGGPSLKVYPALLCSTQPSPESSALIKWSSNLSQASQEAAGENKPPMSKETHLCWVAAPVVPI